MGWFRAIADNQKINRKISDLEDDTETLKRKLKELDLEFNTLYDKVRSALGRMAKRYARMEESQEPEEGVSVPLTDSPSDGLSARQKQINDAILAYRGMRGSGT